MRTVEEGVGDLEAIKEAGLRGVMMPGIPGTDEDYDDPAWDPLYLTFQDDWTAFAHADEMNWHRLMWANDFPHSDSTWPWSQEMLAEHTSQLTDEQTHAILSGNVAGLYDIELPTG